MGIADKEFDTMQTTLLQATQKVTPVNLLL
jgi:hypothetical protein